MDLNDVSQKVAIVHCLIDELNMRGVAISSVTLGSDARYPEFHGNEPIVAILKKYRDEIVAAKRRPQLRASKKSSAVPRDIEMLKEPLNERSRGELRSHVFTLVKMWQNLDKDQVDYTLKPPFWPSKLPFSQPSSKLLKKGELIEAIRHIYAATAQNAPAGSAVGSTVSQISASENPGQIQGQYPVAESHQQDIAASPYLKKSMPSTGQAPVAMQRTAGTDSQLPFPEKQVDVHFGELAPGLHRAESESHTVVQLNQGTPKSHKSSSDPASDSSGLHSDCEPNYAGAKTEDGTEKKPNVYRVIDHSDSPETQPGDHRICTGSILDKLSLVEHMSDDSTLIKANYERFKAYSQYMSNFRAQYSDILQWRNQQKGDSDDDDMDSEEGVISVDATDSSVKTISSPDQKSTLTELIHCADNLNISRQSGPIASNEASKKSIHNLTPEKDAFDEIYRKNMSPVSFPEPAVSPCCTAMDVNDCPGSDNKEVNSHIATSADREKQKENDVVLNSSVTVIQSQHETEKPESDSLRHDMLQKEACSTGEVHAVSTETQKDTVSTGQLSSADNDVNFENISKFHSIFLNWDDDGDPDHLNYTLGPHLARDTETGLVSSIYYDPAKKGRNLQDGWALIQGERVVSLQDGTPSIGTFPLTNEGLPWTRTAFLTYYQNAVDTCIAQEKVVSASRNKDQAVSGTDADFDTFFQELVKKVPPAGLRMADIGDISIRLLDYKRKRFVLQDISTIEVQFDDEADMNAVYEKVRDAYQDLFMKKATLKKKNAPTHSDGIFKKEGVGCQKARIEAAADKDDTPEFLHKAAIQYFAYYSFPWASSTVFKDEGINDGGPSLGTQPRVDIATTSRTKIVYWVQPFRQRISTLASVQEK